MDSDKTETQPTTNETAPSDHSAVVCHPADTYQLHRERYRVFIEDIADGFYEVDLEGAFRYFNDAFCRILGRQPQDIRAHSFRDFMDSENASLAADRIARMEDLGEEGARFMLEIIGSDGQPRHLEVSARPIIAGDGQRIGFRGIARDVTGKIRDQSELVASKKKIEALYAASRNAERRYRAFLKFLPIPLLVHNMDHSIAYMNPAFEKTFGWSREDLAWDPFAPIPPDQIKTTHTGKVSLLTNGVFYGLETKRLTRDGRLLDVIYDGSALYDQDGQPDGLVVTMRDITQSKKDAQTTQVLFKIAKALHRYNDLDGCLNYITAQVKRLMRVDQAHIVLIDAERETYYFRTGAMEDPVAADHVLHTRIPLDAGFAGKVIQSATPHILNTISADEAASLWPSTSLAASLRNLMGVPMQVSSRVIGVIVAANKIDGDFDDEDVVSLSSIASMVSLPIENARINAALRNSYEEIKALTRAKDRMIDHLSHELRTPISVLSATFKMLQDGDRLDRATTDRIFTRSQRNLQRIVDMQSKLKDVIREPDTRAGQTLTRMLDLCVDELEAFAEVEGGAAIAARIRGAIDAYFKPQSLPMEHLCLRDWVAATVAALEPQVDRRRIDFCTTFEENSGVIALPREVLSKIIAGLLRNAVEYTPDGGKIEIIVRSAETGPELMVTDTGVGITAENQQLILGSYFTTADVYQYGTGRPFDFNAGGRGFDLLRMRVFAERYGFTLSMRSRRCPHIPTNADVCPGDTQQCSYCDSAEHCHQSGGTTFSIRFPKVAEAGPSSGLREDG